MGWTRVNGSLRKRVRGREAVVWQMPKRVEWMALVRDVTTRKASPKCRRGFLLEQGAINWALEEIARRVMSERRR